MVEQLKAVVSFYMSPLCISLVISLACSVYTEQRLVVPECSEVLSIPHGWVQSSCPRHIHIEALTCSRTNLNPKIHSCSAISQSKIYSLLLTCQALCNGLRCNVTHLSWWPAAREEVSVVIAMKWDVEDAGVAVEHFLGAVAMVNILESTRCGRHNNIIHSQQNRR